MIDPDKTKPTPDPTSSPAANTPGETKPTGQASPSDESPDRDTPAWEGAEPTEAIGLVDPRHEIPTPPGL